MIIVSEQMFEKIIARGQAIGEEAWRRVLFDAPGLQKNASPGALEFLKQRIVDDAAQRYVVHLAELACPRSFAASAEPQTEKRPSVASAGPPVMAEKPKR